MDRDMSMRMAENNITFLLLQIQASDSFPPHSARDRPLLLRYHQSPVRFGVSLVRAQVMYISQDITRPMLDKHHLSNLP